MLSLFRWLFGYVSFEYKNGFVEEFLSHCHREGIELRDIEARGEYITASCNLKNYKRLHRIVRQHGATTKIIKKHGLPFFLLPLKNRWGFFAGMLCFVLIVSLLSSFVWNIEIEGNERVSDATVMAYLENNNLKCATMWSSVDRDALSWQMLGEFDDFSWVHINKIGTTAVVEINERRIEPSADFDKLEGRNVMQKKLSVCVSRQQNNITLKDIKNYYQLDFFFISIPLYISRSVGEQTQKSEKMLTINDKSLPIGITKYEECFYTSSPSMLSDEELKKLAKLRLSYMEEEEFDGFEIVNVSENYELSDESCEATFSYIIRRKQ